MDYEKKYKEAIERAKEIIECSKSDTKEVRMVLSFFPELAESEDEKVRKGLIAIITDFDSLYLQENYSLSREEAIAWLEKQCEQKPAEWSKEDERDFGIIYGIIYNSCNAEDASRLIAWLKAIKDRVQPQPKQEWSKEDEKIYQSIMDDTVQENQLCSKQIDWLKSLKDRYAFKPSEEQMVVLNDIIINGHLSNANERILKGLQEQLKKLKG